MKKLSIIAVSLILFTSCTQNEIAKNYGGNLTVEIPKGQKLVNVTWKEDEIWYLTRTMDSTDKVETFTFQEKSSFGVWEGTITLKESK